MCNDAGTDIDPSNAWPTALIMSKYTSCHFMCGTNPMVFFKLFFPFYLQLHPSSTCNCYINVT